MKLQKTLTGQEIPKSARGILYLCKFTRNPLKLEVIQSSVFESAYIALQYYAEIPNPESQLITGKTYDGLISNLAKLHNNINDKKWLKELSLQL